MNSLFNPVPAQQARLLVAQGDLTEAARWTTEAGFSADDEPDYPRELGHLVLARVLLAQGRPDQALALLDRLRAAAAARRRPEGAPSLSCPCTDEARRPSQQRVADRAGLSGAGLARTA